MLERAKGLAALGLCVIPLRSKEKAPDIQALPEGSWKRFQTERPTEGDLHKWFGNGVQRNIGIPLGAGSGVVVIETDSEKAEAWCAANLPATPMATKSARGVHRYYRFPTGPNARADIPATIALDDGTAIEIKRGGQYVVGLGSTHPSGHVYTEIGEWPASIEAVPEFPIDELIAVTGRCDAGRPALPRVISDGERNTTVFKEGARLRRLGFDEPELHAALSVINQRRCHPPLPDREVRDIARSCMRYDAADDTFPATEVGDAEYFATCNADALRCDHRSKTWLLFDQHHWTPQTSGEVYRLAFDAIRARQSAANKFKGDGRAVRVKWALAGEQRKRLTNLLALAENVKPLADAGEGWDAAPGLLAVRNGVIDLRTGTLRPGRPDDRITLASPLDFNPDASTAKWAQFVLDVCDGREDLAHYLQGVFGYLLTGETGEQCFWICYGTGSNGKSTLLEMMTRHVLPQHAWTMNCPSAKWTDAMSDYQKAQLVGRRLIVSKENEQTQRLNTEFIKSLTGDESISARHPYGRPFNFTPVAKFILAVNHKPTILDETHGMWRRVRLVPFVRTFPLNPHFAETLVAEAGGALAWAVEGAVRYYREGLPTPEFVIAATNDYRQESDSLAPFFAERCVFGATHRTKAQQMFDELRDWYDARQTPQFERLSQVEFGRRIANDPRFVVGKGTGDERRTVVYQGVGLLDRTRRDDDGPPL